MRNCCCGSSNSTNLQSMKFIALYIFPFFKNSSRYERCSCLTLTSYNFWFILFGTAKRNIYIMYRLPTPSITYMVSKLLTYEKEKQDSSNLIISIFWAILNFLVRSNAACSLYRYTVCKILILNKNNYKL